MQQGCLLPPCLFNIYAEHIMRNAGPDELQAGIKTARRNKQGDNIQPWCTPFPILNQSIIPCPVLSVASWPAYRFLRKQVRWSGTHISFRVFYSLLWPTQSKALTYWSSTWFSGIPLLFPCSIKCWNLISVSSASLKPSLYIWKFLVHILLKPSLKDFEHYLAKQWTKMDRNG